jgi:heparan-alpha-glucosaminide N-acetyltransferase
VARIASVDVLRGLTILLMVFVNDLGHAAPSWMHHIKPSNADGMTLADIVFPTFLFIVGISIPLALERAQAAGKSKLAQLGHILIRSAGLLFMGVIYMNESHDITLGEPLWGLLALISLILAWIVLPAERGPQRNLLLILKIIGILGIIGLCAIFRRTPSDTSILLWGPVKDWVWFRPEWWEILGLIGWAYLVCAIITLFLGKRREWLMGAMGILMLLHIALHKGSLFDRLNLQNKPWLDSASPFLETLKRGFEELGRYVSLGGALGSLAAVTMAGCVLGSVLRRDSDVASPRCRALWALVFVTGLFLAGFVTDTLEGINKIGDTPTWCFWCAALATVVWIMLYLVIDVAGFRAWAAVFRMAGANPLVAYFLHPIVLFVISYTSFEAKLLSYKEATDPQTVILGSAAMAFFVCLLAALLGRLGLRMRL